MVALITTPIVRTLAFKVGAVLIVILGKFPGMKDSKLPYFAPQYMVPEFKRYVSDITNTATIGVGPDKQPARSVVAMLEEYYANEKAELPEQMQFEVAVEDGDIEDVF